MNLGQGIRLGLATLLVAGVCVVSVPIARAQGGPGGPGGFQMTPEMRARFEAMRKWRDQHKNMSNLGELLYQVQELNKMPGFQFDKKQSTSMLKVVNTWHTKTTLSEDQAKSISKQMSDVLTTKQLKKLTTIETPTQRMQRGGGFGGGRPGGGPGGPGGPRPGGFGGRPGGGPGGKGGGFTLPKQGWNPLNPDSMPFERARQMSKPRMEEFVSSLQKQAKG